MIETRALFEAEDGLMTPECESKFALSLWNLEFDFRPMRVAQRKYRQNRDLKCFIRIGMCSGRVVG
jgi:hypothetical protein